MSQSQDIKNSICPYCKGDLELLNHQLDKVCHKCKMGFEFIIDETASGYIIGNGYYYKDLIKRCRQKIKTSVEKDEKNKFKVE
jgi:hypothetical protein